MNFRQEEKVMRNHKNFRVACTKRLGQLWLLAILIGLFCGVVTKAQTPTHETQSLKKSSLTEGFVLVEGDIQVLARHAVNGRFQPKATYSTNLWTFGVVPFEFDGNVSQSNRNAMLAAMVEWEAVANVHFQPHQGEFSFIYIQNSTGNNSPIGMVSGKQIINITSWGSKFIMAHELGHCLGLWHEQSRWDRDTYVHINIGNIQAGKEGNFDVNAFAQFYGPYDFDSVMHYDKCAFSTGCPPGFTCDCAPGTETITVLPPYNTEWQNKIGQRTHLSYLDGTTISFLYPYIGWVFVDKNAGWFGNGSFQNPFTSFIQGAASVPANGTVIVQPGSYAAAGIYTKPMTIRAPLGGVSLGDGN